MTMGSLREGVVIRLGLSIGVLWLALGLNGCSTSVDTVREGDGASDDVSTDAEFGGGDVQSFDAAADSARVDTDDAAPALDAVSVSDVVDEADTDGVEDTGELDVADTREPDALDGGGDVDSTDAGEEDTADVTPDIDADEFACPEGTFEDGDRCVECLGDAHCGMCRVCSDGRCVAECATDADCGDGLLCEAGCCVDGGVCGRDEENACGGCGPLDGSPGASCGACGRLACTAAGGLRCEEAPICSPSTRRCSGSTVQVCQPTGCGWSASTTCDLCSGGACVACGAEGEPCCADGACDDGAVCEAGRCERDCGRVSTGRGGAADLPLIRDVAFLNIPLDDVDAGGRSYHIGVDLTIGDYVTGHHSDDPFYGAHVMAHVGPLSYYKVFNPGEYPLGMFIDNVNPNYCRACAPGFPCMAWCDRCTPEFRHQFANRVTAAHFEVYSHDPAYGGVRTSVDRFSIASGGGLYAESLGVIRLPRESDPRVARLNGFVWTRAGGPAAAEGQFTIDIFSHGPPIPTSTGHPVYGFGSTSTNADGYYNPGPMPFGTYQVYIRDNIARTKYLYSMTIGAEDIRLDFMLDEPCFGWDGACDAIPY